MGDTPDRSDGARARARLIDLATELRLRGHVAMSEHVVSLAVMAASGVDVSQQIAFTAEIYTAEARKVDEVASAFSRAAQDLTAPRAEVPS